MATWTVGTGQTYSTIQSALDALYTAVTTSTFTVTQTIAVYNGTYNEKITPNAGLIPTATYRLVITAADGNSPIIDGQASRQYAIQNIGVSYVTFNGFITRNTTLREIDYESCSYGIISNNIAGPNVYGINLYKGVGGSISAVGGHIVYNNFIFGSTGGEGGGIVGDELSGCTIYNNLIINCTQGIDTYDVIGNTYIYNNTFYGNGQGIRFEDDVATNITFKNNAVYNSTGHCIQFLDPYSAQTNLVSDYNDLYIAGTAKVGNWSGVDKTSLGDWQGASNQDSHSIGTDPSFVTAGGTTAPAYKLATGSGALKVGVNLYATVATDYFGWPRPNTTAFDIGFYEQLLIATDASSNIWVQDINGISSVGFK